MTFRARPAFSKKVIQSAKEITFARSGFDPLISGLWARRCLLVSLKDEQK